MKALNLLFLLLLGSNAIAQDYKEIYTIELDTDADVITDKIAVYSILEEPLRGDYKIINHAKSRYVLGTFVDGKVHGVLKEYLEDTLAYTYNYSYGLKNGESIEFGKDGTVFMRTNWKDGREHGISWDIDNGESYYFKGNKVTKEKYNEYAKYKVEN